MALNLVMVVVQVSMHMEKLVGQDVHASLSLMKMAQSQPRNAWIPGLAVMEMGV